MRPAAIKLLLVVSMASVIYQSADALATSGGAARVVVPHLTIKPGTVAPGAKITLTGSHFSSNQIVKFYVGPPRAGADLWGATRAGKDGRFHKTFTVNPAATAGRYVVVACQRNCAIKAKASFQIKPRLKIHPAIVAPGAKITLTGSNFSPSQLVKFFVGPPRAGADLWGTTRASEKGGFRKTFTVNPAATAGRYVVVACQRSCTIKAKVSFQIMTRRG